MQNKNELKSYLAVVNYYDTVKDENAEMYLNILARNIEEVVQTIYKEIPKDFLNEILQIVLQETYVALVAEKEVE